MAEIVAKMDSADRACSATTLVDGPLFEFFFSKTPDDDDDDATLVKESNVSKGTTFNSVGRTKPTTLQMPEV